MNELWQTNVIDAGKLPLLFCLLSFVVTFVITRVIVRLIRSGKGPFKDNSVGGVHVHHVVPGLFLMTTGGFLALSTQTTGWVSSGGVLFGMGLALVLDEFALVLHLEDVYWEQQGRLSVDIVFIVTAIMVLLIVVGSPFGVRMESSELWIRLLVTLLFIAHLIAVGITAMKGKVITAVVALFLFVVAIAGAIRLARPHSPWARRRYPEGSEKLTRATERDRHVETKWRSKIYWLQDAVAGIGATDPDRTSSSAGGGPTD